jgi:hypothetical protein
LASEKWSGARQRARFALKHWLPYLLVLAGVVVWRAFFLVIPEDPNRPDLLYSLASQPLGTLLRLAQIAMQDLINNLVGVWYLTIEPQAIDFTDRAVLFSFFLAAITAGLAIFYLLRLQGEEDDALISTSSWHRQAIGLGLLAALLGSLPVWVTDRQAIVGLYSGRFALAAMFGLSIMLVGLLEWFTPAACRRSSWWAC